MFKREKKVYLELTDAERRLVRMYLMNWRNKLTAQGRDAGPVNDLLFEADGSRLETTGFLHTPLFVFWGHRAA